MAAAVSCRGHRDDGRVAGGHLGDDDVGVGQVDGQGLGPVDGSAAARSGDDLVAAGECLRDDALTDHAGGPDDGDLHVCLL